MRRNLFRLRLRLDTKLKVAILLHAHLRSFRKTHSSFIENLQNIIEKRISKPDIFIHTWDTEEFLTKTWHEGVKEACPTNPEDIEDLYKPKSYLLERQVIKNPDLCAFGRPIEALKAPWESFHKSWKLMEEEERSSGFKYDIVVVSRPDVQYFNNIFIDEVLETDYLWQTQVFTKVAASDVILFGGRAQINLLNDFYENFDKLHSHEIISRYSNNESVFNDFITQIANVRKSQYCMPRDWRILRSDWEPDHVFGHRKWDRDLAIQDINSMERFKFFRRQNDRS